MLPTGFTDGILNGTSFTVYFTNSGINKTVNSWTMKYYYTFAAVACNNYKDL